MSTSKPTPASAAPAAGMSNRATKAQPEAELEYVEHPIRHSWTFVISASNER